MRDRSLVQRYSIVELFVAAVDVIVDVKNVVGAEAGAVVVVFVVVVVVDIVDEQMTASQKLEVG